MWEPTTRGTSPAEKVCHNGLCSKKTSEIMHYILDRHGIRYFCKEHWTDICVFMRDVRLALIAQEITGLAAMRMPSPCGVLNTQTNGGTCAPIIS